MYCDDSTAALRGQDCQTISCCSIKLATQRLSRIRMSAILDLIDPATVLVLGGTAVFVHWLLKEPPNLPPGPKRWPILGALLTMPKYPIDKGHLSMQELAKKYGGLFSVKVGSMWMVVVADVDVAREVFIKQAINFSDRPVHSGPMKKAKELFGEFGVIWASGESKKEIRKFTISAMREFGFGKRSLIDRVLQETTYLREEMMKTEGKAWNPRDLMSKAVGNIICSICFGDRFMYDDPEFVAIMSHLTTISETLTFFELSMIFDWLAYLPLPKGKREKQNIAAVMALDECIEQQIKKHEATFDPTQIRDFIDLYLKAKQEEDTDMFSPLVLRRIIMDLYFAGTDTTSTALNWLLKFLIAHPHVQDRCRQEVDKVVGRERAADMSDKAEMPYVEATIHEMLRRASIAPASVPHYAMESGTVQGYTIPRGCNVILSLYTINMDPELWPEPHEFRPERWLDDNGGFVPNRNFIPFGVGPRACLGESLSRQELFLFFTSMLQHFTFHKEAPDQQLDFEGIMGITLQPTPYNLVAKPREGE